ncbi:MAG: holo-ACP synthase [Candidatus Zixiibacteriota bacterium]
MVISTGIDIVEIQRIGKIYDRFRDKFLKRLYSDEEIEILHKRPGVMLSVMAGKFAAKEAVIKALGVIFDSGVYLKDIEILNHASGMPYVHLPDRLNKVMSGREIIVSITHESNYAAAVAIISGK